MKQICAAGSAVDPECLNAAPHRPCSPGEPKGAGLQSAKKCVAAVYQQGTLDKNVTCEGGDSTKA